MGNRFVMRDCPACNKSHELDTIIEPTDTRSKLRVRTPNGVLEAKCLGVCPATLQFVTVRLEGTLEATP